MNTLFKNAILLTMQDNDIKDEIIIPRYSHNLVVADDIISFIGDDNELLTFTKDHNIDKTIDCEGNILMPGFINTHGHAPMTFVRNYADNLPLDKWLNEKIFPLEAKLTDEDVYWFTKLAILEQIESGITSSMEMYYHIPSMIKACLEMNYRMVFNDCVMSFDKEPKKSERLYHYINENPDDKDKLTRYEFGLHAVYTNNDETFTYISEMIHKYKCPMIIHNSETLKEVDECKAQYNMTPTELLDKYGLLDFGGNHAHCTFLSDHDMELFKEHNVIASINMASNLKLGSGIANLKKYKERGVMLAVGTDSVSSNNALNLFREMYIIAVLSKVRASDVNALDPSYILQMATRNGAIANNDDTIGILEVGKKADLVEISIHKSNMCPVNDLVHSLIYSADKHNIRRTIVNGKILYERDQFLLDMDIDEVYRKVQELTDDIKKR